MSRELKPCGTRAAYQRHMRAGEEPCDPCRDAMRAANRQFEESRPPRKRNRRELKPCGTRAAYARHRRNGETPCDACRAAESAATSSRARPARQQLLQPCGTAAAHQRHKRNGETPCDACRAAYSEYINAYKKRKRSPGLPVSSPEDAHKAPCVDPRNGYVWDPVRDDETPAEARVRQAEAAVLCRTACPVFAWCYESAPRSGGVVAGVRS